MKFKELAVGDLFEFDRTGLPVGHGLAGGTWKKISARRYQRTEDGMICRVGNINVPVLKLTPPPAPEPMPAPKEHPLKPTAATDRGIASRMANYRETYRQTGDHRAAIRAYCAGNRWLEENARAVGNW